MAVITALSRPAVELALQQYDVGSLIDHRAASEGIENTNYFLRTTTDRTSDSDVREYVLTLIEHANSISQDRTLMVDVLDRCFEFGLPVAPIVRTKGMDASTKIKNKPAYLSRKLRGQHVALPTHDQCGAIGRFLARFHIATRQIDAKQYPYERDAEWIQSKADDVSLTLGFNDQKLLENAVAQIRSLLERGDVQEMPQGVIHGDLFRDNALFNEYGLTGIVDFHHSGHGYWIYDLAVALNDWCRQHETMDEARSYTLMREYHAIRPLQREEIWFLPIFMTYASTAFWLSRLIVSIREDLPRDYPVKDPQEFGQLVFQHVSRPFRLDEALLLS